jgi:hypothetical protein
VIGTLRSETGYWIRGPGRGRVSSGRVRESLTVSSMDHDNIPGDEPPVDGMHVVVRLRRDFTVTDAVKLQAAARAAYTQVNPATGAQDAAAAVTSAADAIFTILESEGLLGPTADRTLADGARDGLQPGGWRGQVTLNEAHRLQSSSACFDDGDVFALPAGACRRL